MPYVITITGPSGAGKSTIGGLAGLGDKISGMSQSQTDGTAGLSLSSH